MSAGRLFIAWFDNEDEVLDATRAARKAGLAIEDVYAPYAIHGIDEAMGLRQSRLTWVCFGAGLGGLLSMLLFLWWMTVVSWPLNVGGKPLFSWQAYIPVVFEFTVLCAGLSTVAALLFAAGLWPGKQRVVLPGVTNDRFALALLTGERFDESAARKLCTGCGALSTELLAPEAPPASPAATPEEPALPLAARTAEVKP
jgi:Protein of unknown function (DUF3341)